uniref:Receptor ligand binding region domain-containing protein n=1 Tax=Anopheles coluzzii TaxID=1518534 RepID=A0A8W7PBS2_ANOCL
LSAVSPNADDDDDDGTPNRLGSVHRGQWPKQAEAAPSSPSIPPSLQRPVRALLQTAAPHRQERSPPSAMASGAGRNRNGASLNCVPFVCCAVLLCWVGCHTPPPVTAHPRDHRPTVQRSVEDTEIGQLLSSLLDGAGRDGDDYNLEEDGESTGGGVAGSAGSGNGSSLAGGHIDRVHKRSLSNLEIQPIIDDTNYTVYHVGVLMASHLDSPFDLERCGPAIDLALELVNQSLMKVHNVRLSKVQRSYATCSGSKSPGLAADLHFKHSVIAFIGPACAFALEPVAQLADYWNTPIITGMGDQPLLRPVADGDLKSKFI